MQPTNSLVLPQPYSTRATTTSSHPQLRDLLILPADGGNVAVSVCYESLCSVDLWGSRLPDYTPLEFSPSTLASGMGLIAAGGQSSEVALKSARPGSDWCTQYLPARTTGVKGSINNSIFIFPSPTSASTPRLLVGNNDDKIVVYDVAGRLPDYQAAKRRRVRARKGGWSVVEASWAAERGEKEYGASRRGGEDEEDGGDEGVEECPTFDGGGECHLVPVPHEDVHLPTAVNHCSVSPDGRRMVAVGDTPEVFLFDARTSGYELAQRFRASNDASFSTDWSQDNVTFTVASQDGFVHVYDIRNLPSSDSEAPRKVAELKTTQSGPAGAARKVKFSPGGPRLDCGLLAFTEHRNRVHIVDARTFETYQILDVPLTSPFPSSAFSLPAPPPLRPRPHPPTRTRFSRRPPLSRFASTLSTGSGTRTPKNEIEREELEREMRERVERRVEEENRRIRAEARDERRARAFAAQRARRERASQTEEDEEEGSEEEEDVEIVDARGEGEDGGWQTARLRPRGHDEDDDEDESDEEEEGDEENEEEERDEAMHDVPPDEDDSYEDNITSFEARVARTVNNPFHAAVPHNWDDDSSSTASSVNTTRPRRFEPASDSRMPVGQRPHSLFERLGGVSAAGPSRPSDPRTTASSTSSPTFTTSSNPPPVRRNFSGYAPLHPNSFSASSSSNPGSSSGPRATSTFYLPSSSAPGNGGGSTRTGTSYYYTTYVPPASSSSSYTSTNPSLSFTFGPPASSSQPRREAFTSPLTSLFSAPLVSGIGGGLAGSSLGGVGVYTSTSAFFPLESTPGDLLGLDWDEFGERLVVATGERIWEWDVDVRGRRGVGEWGVR
ncbi:hypothetical protein JCM8547_006851 [Rhodosporidiobolus lusitaniae]